MNSEIPKILAVWYKKNQRNLPWRESRNPYFIWLSEIILQQTRVAQGLPYFLKFQEAFPTVQSLAEAEEDKVLKLWQGLGYYSRARNLMAAAKQVTQEFQGEFPTDYDSLMTLKGVGPYTAAAISSIAFNEPKAVVDGNVIRVVSRLFGITESVSEASVIKQINELAQSLLDPKNPGRHNQAMMDFGSIQCVPKNPICLECSLARQCIAFKNDTVNSIPLKTAKTKRRSRYFHFLLVTDGEQILIEKRGGEDVWAGLYQFPLIEAQDSALLTNAEFEDMLGLNGVQIFKSTVLKKHILSHQDIFATICWAQATSFSNVNFLTAKPSDLHTFAVPRLLDRFLETADLSVLF